VITGTLSNGEISDDLYHAARSTATVIVLMGMAQLSKIMRLFSDARSADEPVAIVQHATLPTQRFVVGNTENMVQLAHDRQIDSPAVIIIGKVVNERLAMNERLQSLFEQPMMKIAV
jgi:uroporphyrin-III C-methyltransferase